MIGLHINARYDGTFPRDSRVTVCVDLDLEQLRWVRRQVGPNHLLVVRYWVDPQQDAYLADPILGARQWMDRFYDRMRIAHVNVAPVVFQGLNEIARDKSEAHAIFERERLRWMHQQRIGAAVGAFSVGQPESSDLRCWWLPAIRSMTDWDIWLTHEYYSDREDLDDPGCWHVGRCLRMMDEIPELRDKWHVIGEWGRDYIPDTGRGKPGWKATCNAETYLEEMAIYSSRLAAARRNILGACAFGVGDMRRWKNFDVTDLVSKMP